LLSFLVYDKLRADLECADSLVVCKVDFCVREVGSTKNPNSEGALYVPGPGVIFLVSLGSKVTSLCCLEKTGALLLWYLSTKYWPFGLTSTLGLYYPGPGIAEALLSCVSSNLFKLRPWEYLGPPGLL
jgi:hypothetical protein